MHPNPIFRAAPMDTNLAFARERGFGTLCVNGDDGPLAAHVPFLLSDDGRVLEFHLMRSNPIVQALPGRALMAIAGPDDYISPDWYELPDQVPTWNYVAVHLRGPLDLRPEAGLRDLLDRQTAQFETLLQPKTPWSPDKMPQHVIQRLMRMIVPCRMQIDDVQGTWKLAQNKPDAARMSAARHLEAFGHGPDARLLAGLMKGAGQP